MLTFVGMARAGLTSVVIAGWNQHLARSATRYVPRCAITVYWVLILAGISLTDWLGDFCNPAVGIQA